jgi:2-methylisocitrate lyase-like PEP mutase family enzyme
MVEGPGARLRRLIARGPGLAAPGASDAFTARIIERAGFEVVYLGGNALGLSLAKGQPLVTLTETAEATTRITQVVEAPLIVDAGAGFGDPAHCHRAVREIEAAGAAALHIDDQPYPKRPGYHRGSGGLAALETAVARLSVAVRARRDPDLLIIARTDALRVSGSLNAAIERGRAYAAAGVDALMVLDAEPEHVAAIQGAVPTLPLVWIGGVVPPVPNLVSLREAGFAIALYPFNGVTAVAEAVTALWANLAATGEIVQAGEVLLRMRGELQEIIGMRTYWDIEDQIEADHAET